MEPTQDVHAERPSREPRRAALNIYMRPAEKQAYKLLARSSLNTTASKLCWCGYLVMYEFGPLFLVPAIEPGGWPMIKRSVLARMKESR